MAAATPRSGILAEFASPEALLATLERLRETGHARLDTFTPFPVEGVEEWLGAERSSIPRWALAAGVAGALLAYAIQSWTAAVDYPLVVGGRPLNSLPAWVPITFETTILFASLATFVMLLVKARLTMLWHPVFEVPGIESAQGDRYWVIVGDAVQGRQGTAAELRRLGALRVVELEEER